MFSPAGRNALLLGAVVPLLALLSCPTVAHAQRGDAYRPDWKQHQDDRSRDDYNARERERERERERDRRDDAKAKGIVVGVVGTAVLAGVIAAAANREKEKRQRADYCINRYGNYDRANDTYRGQDGYTYRCR